MNELKKLTQDLSSLSKTLLESSSPANGRMDTSKLIKDMMPCIESDDYRGTSHVAVIIPGGFENYGGNDGGQYIIERQLAYKEFLAQLPETKRQIKIDYKSEFQSILEKADFLEQWNALTSSEKGDWLYLDYSMYGVLREKLSMNDFSFELEGCHINNFEDSPKELKDWATADQGSKIALYKAKKALENSDYKDFLELDCILESANKTLSEKEKKAIVIDYLEKKGNYFPSWYERLPRKNDRPWVESTLNSLRNKEDAFTGYDKIQYAIELPDVLKKWCGEMTMKGEVLDREILKAQQKQRGIDYQQNKKQLTIEEVEALYPMIMLEHKLKGDLSKKDVEQLALESAGTVYEKFFKDDEVKNLGDAACYTRRSCMFVKLKDHFISVSSKKLKI